MSATGVTTAANPMPYLFAEERHGDRQATEAMLLTFNADLSFFEARALGLCQATGARVTILADAGVWDPDPRGTRSAGRGYHLGLVSTRGAFHPKVVVVVGPKRAVVAIGSGNLTMSGWQSNAETWTVFTGDTTTAPAALTTVVELLDDLTGMVDPVARSGLSRTATELSALLGRSVLDDTGHRILTSFRAPILTQLPAGPVDDVRMYAPFHDPDCAGVAAALARFQPRTATVMVQPGATVINPRALRDSLAGSGARWDVVADAEQATRTGHYRHGKIIEWTTGNERWALTGSPNLSRAALLHAVPAGNHEVAVLSPLNTSLFPQESPLVLGDIPCVTIPLSRHTAGVPALPGLLAAFLVPGGVQLALSAPLQAPATLQISYLRDAPEEWSDVATVPANHDALMLADVEVPASSRVRLVTSTEHGLRVGKLVYVTDPERAQSRLAATRLSKAHRAPARDFWGDDIELLQALSEDLAQLASDAAATRAPGSGGRRTEEDGAETGESHPRRDTDKTPWLWILDQAITNHGAELAAFGLGLPTPPRGDDGTRLGWIDLLTDDKTAALESDTAEAADAEEQDDNPDQEEGPAHDRDTEEHKQARRRRSEEWSTKAGLVPLSSRLVALRLVLVYWSGGNWKDSDLGPHRIVARLLRSLTSGATPTDLEPRIGSLTAVAMAMMRDRTDLTTRNEGALLFTRLRDELGYLTLAADPDLVAEYTRFQRTPSRQAMQPDHVMKHLRVLQNEDPLSDTIANLEDSGYRVERPSNRLILVRGDFDNPELVALQAVGYAERHSPVGVWAVSDDGDWAFMSWNKPDLIRATHVVGAPTRWLHQRFTGLVGPAALYERRFQNDGLQRVVRHGRLTQIFPEAIEALTRLGLARPDPPLSAVS